MFNSVNVDYKYWELDETSKKEKENYKVKF